MIDEQVVLFGGATSRESQFEGFRAAIRSAFPGARVHVFCPKETCDHEWWVGVPNLTGQPGPASAIAKDCPSLSLSLLQTQPSSAFSHGPSSNLSQHQHAPASA